MGRFGGLSSVEESWWGSTFGAVQPVDTTDRWTLVAVRSDTLLGPIVFVRRQSLVTMGEILECPCAVLYMGPAPCFGGGFLILVQEEGWVLEIVFSLYYF